MSEMSKISTDGWTLVIRSRVRVVEVAPGRVHGLVVRAAADRHERDRLRVVRVGHVRDVRARAVEGLGTQSWPSGSSGGGTAVTSMPIAFRSSAHWESSVEVVAVVVRVGHEPAPAEVLALEDLHVALRDAAVPGRDELRVLGVGDVDDLEAVAVGAREGEGPLLAPAPARASCRPSASCPRRGTWIVANSMSVPAFTSSGALRFGYAMFRMCSIASPRPVSSTAAAVGAKTASETSDSRTTGFKAGSFRLAGCLHGTQRSRMDKLADLWDLYAGSASQSSQTRSIAAATMPTTISVVLSRPRVSSAR